MLAGVQNEKKHPPSFEIESFSKDHMQLEFQAAKVRDEQLKRVLSAGLAWLPEVFMALRRNVWLQAQRHKYFATAMS